MFGVGDRVRLVDLWRHPPVGTIVAIATDPCEVYADWLVRGDRVEVNLGGPKPVGELFEREFPGRVAFRVLWDTQVTPTHWYPRHDLAALD